MVVQLPNSAGRGGEIERGREGTVALITHAAGSQGSDRATARTLAGQKADSPLTDVHRPSKDFLGKGAALAVNFAAWGANCGRMAQALRQRYDWQEEAVRFFTQFATTPSDVSPQALAVIEAGLARGVETHRIIRAARMLQEYELMFWDTLLAQSAHET